MTTITDVAKEAGVSKTTVSRILNKQGNFSEETINKVFAAAKQLNYRPNEIARALGKNKSKTVALIFPTRDIPAFVEIQSSIEEAFYDRGYKVMLYSSLFDKEKEDMSLPILEKNMIDGIVFGTFAKDITALVASSLPIVSSGRKVDAKIPTVKANDKGAGILAAKHLLSKGCRKLLYLTSHPNGIKSDERYEGFYSVLKNTDIELWCYQISLTEQINQDFSDTISKMIVEHPDADGIFAETDILAMSCIQNYTKLGYVIPKDVKIMGYGNNYFSQLVTPALTTIKCDTKVQAQEIARILITMIEEGKYEDGDVEIPVTLVERHTT